MDYEARAEKIIYANDKFDSSIHHSNESIGINPYPGIMEQTVNETLRIANKQQPELSILSTLIGMSAAIGGQYRLEGGGRLNLYGIGISGTGTGKDKAMGSAVALARSAGAEVMGSPGSGAALEDSLSENNTRLLLNIDEVAHFIAAMNDPRQTHNASLAGNLLKLFSASRGSYITRKLASSSGNIQKHCDHPCVSMIGFACPEKLGEAFGRSSNIDDGLIGRILFAMGREEVSPRRSRFEFALSDEARETAKRIGCSGETLIRFNEDADEMMDELIVKLDKMGNGSPNPFAKNLKMRSFEKMERIAGVLAVWDNPSSPIIKSRHVEWSMGLILYSDATILKFTENFLHGGEVQTNAAKIMTIIEKMKNGDLKLMRSSFIIARKAGAYARSALLKASHLSKKEFDEALDHLTDLEQIKQIEIVVGDKICKAITLE